jgi:outer membrane protein TolC
MKWSQRGIRSGWAAALVLGTVSIAASEPLTADKAVQLALTRSAQMINSDANVVDARSGVYFAYSGVLPSLSAGWSRDGALTTKSSGDRAFGGVVFPSKPIDAEGYSSAPTLSGHWPILNLASIEGLRAARTSLNAAQLRRSATRAQVALDTRGLFYNVVKSVHLAVVSTDAAKLARDDERRVQALFEVGSVSKSDLLKAQVRTAQAQLDSLTRHYSVTEQRFTLARQLGVKETELGEVDTALTASVQDFDEEALLGEAEKSRPDIRAAEAELRAARTSLRSANLARLPFVELSGVGTWSQKSSFKNRYFLTDSVGQPYESVITGRNQFDRDLRGSVALTWNLFSGMRTESQIARARAGVLVAEETRDAARRNLQAEVHQALLGYREAMAGLEVAERGQASADENVRLTQQKYNVGSSTILELIDAQVQLQQARSNRVSALAAIRFAEATLNRVRGGSE